jgi:hypothetical protein
MVAGVARVERKLRVCVALPQAFRPSVNDKVTGKVGVWCFDQRAFAKPTREQLARLLSHAKPGLNRRTVAGIATRHPA